LSLVISSTFITDLCTVIALSVLEPCFFGRYGELVIEPELKGAFAALLVLRSLGASRA
jgi:hypothetical protein